MNREKLNQLIEYLKIVKEDSHFGDDVLFTHRIAHHALDFQDIMDDMYCTLNEVIDSTLLHGDLGNVVESYESPHETRMVKVNAPIDLKIADLVELFNNIPNVSTMFSCENEGGCAFIRFRVSGDWTEIVKDMVETSSNVSIQSSWTPWENSYIHDLFIPIEHLEETTKTFRLKHGQGNEIQCR